jgi:protein ImuB
MEIRGRVVVTAANHAASAVGVAPGMALADARAVSPGLAGMAADFEADAALLDRIAAWCYRYTPWSAVEGQDGVWLDVTGCAHLFGGEAALLETLRARLGGFGLETRGALADTPGAAWAVSRYGGNQDGGMILPPGGAQTALAGLPVAALRLGPATVAGLSRLGLKRIGDLYTMPRAPLTTRFGAEVTMRLDQALGRLAEPIAPRRPVPRHRVRLVFPEAIGLADDIAAGLHRLLQRLCERLDQAGQGCRRLELTLCRVDGSAQTVGIGTAGPARDAAHLALLFAERLGHLDPGFGVEAMILAAPVTEPLAPAQIETFAAGRASEVSSDVSAAIDPLLDRLGNRLGFDRLVVLRARESHLPDAALRVVPAADAIGDTTGGAAWPVGRARPLRLLNRPERVETIAPVPDRAPPGAFLWRRVRRRLRAAEGPERIAPEWWRADPGWTGGVRDYWRVEDEAGDRFWLFREDGGQRGAAPRWFLHGVFA